MKYLLPLACLALASCAAQKALPQYTEAEKAAQRGGISYWQPDSTSRADTVPHTPRWAVAVPPMKVDSVIVEPHRTLLDKLLGRKPDITRANVLPMSVGKKSTVTIYQGPATVTTTTLGKKSTGAVGAGATATSIDKAKGPTAVGDSATAIDNTKQGQRGGAGASGPGAHAEATTVKPGLPWGRIAAGVVGGGFLIWVVFFGGGTVLLAAVRRKSSTTNQA